MDGGMSYADAQAAVGRSANIVSDPPRVLDMDSGTPTGGSARRTAPTDPGDLPDRPALLGAGLPLRRPQKPVRRLTKSLPVPRRMRRRSRAPTGSGLGSRRASTSFSEHGVGHLSHRAHIATMERSQPARDRALPATVDSFLR
jgi:hypothetical protein